ncbi:MAG: solute-binding protein [Methanococci archaeon]|nr:solute-binding protein [Methanococci archaeon]
MNKNRKIKYAIILVSFLISITCYAYFFPEIQFSKNSKDTLTVYACGGSTEMLNKVDQLFEKKYHCKINLISSNTVEYLNLLTHVKKGDVVISRSTETPEYLRDLGAVDNYSIAYFTTWDIVVRRGNPKHIKTINDLLKPDIKVLTASGASINEYGIFNQKSWSFVSELYDKSYKDFNCRRAMLKYFLDGYGDACIVEDRLIHDLHVEDDVSTIKIPWKFYYLQSSVFTISVLKYSKHKELDEKYIDFILNNDTVKEIMKSYGYIPANTEEGKYILRRYYESQ